MRTGLLGVLIVVIALSVAAIALAAKPKTPPLTSVTVAVDGLHCKACVDELQKDLGKVSGVSELKVTQTPGQATAKLNESKITASEFVALIANHPRAMDHEKTYGAQLVAYIDTTMCAKQKTMCDACFTEIPKVLKAVKGVSDVTLDETGKIAAISFVKDAKVSTSALSKALGSSNFKFQVKYVTAVPSSSKSNQKQDSGHESMGHDGDCGMGPGCNM